MTPTNERFVIMGKMLSPYGVRGWINALPFTAQPETLLDYPRWRLRRGNLEKTLTLKNGRVHNGRLVVAFDAIDTREAADELRGMTVVLARDALPAIPADEIYCADLVGLNVVNRSGENLGAVDAVRDYGAAPVLHVASDAMAQDGGKAPKRASGARASSKNKNEILIPFVSTYVDDISLDERLIRVDYERDWA